MSSGFYNDSSFLDYLIQYGEENDTLDYKSIEYHKSEFTELLKDVMSMANGISDERKYILIGIKKTQTERTLLGLEELSDSADYENVIQENIEPTISIKYYMHTFNGKKYGILEISGNKNRPYMMRKDYGNSLKKGDIWIRKGTRQSRAVRADLDMMNKLNNKAFSKEDVLLGYTDRMQLIFSVKSSYFKKDDLPSQKERIKLERLLHELEQHNAEYSSKSGMMKSVNKYPLISLFEGKQFDDEKKAIRVGNSSYGMPLYKTEVQLKEAIQNVDNDYEGEDSYFLFETIAFKLNFCIQNKGNTFLEEVRIKMYFDNKIFIVADRVYPKPQPNNILAPVTPSSHINTGYPEVIDEQDRTIVQESHKIIRHKDIIKVFHEDLRVLVCPPDGVESTQIKYSISARNLPDLIEGVIKVRIDD